MITFVQRFVGKGTVVTNTDAVIAATPVPKGGVVHGVSMEVHLQQLEQPVINNVMYGLTGYAVPILDPDGGATYDAIWDAQVPKNINEASGAIDLDTGSAVATPEYEPGFVNWTGLYDMESGPRRWYRRRKVLTGASGGRGPAATGTMTHYLPQDVVRVNESLNIRARVPTAIMLGLSSPVISQTTGTVLTSPNKTQWLQLTFLEDTAIDALKWLFGLVEAGADTPYEEQAVELQQILMPAMFEGSADQFATGSWQFTVMGSWTVSVPGTLSVGKLDGDK